MVLFNHSTKELTAKVVYYGPGLGGKTTNLHWIHEQLPIKNKGKMLSLSTETDRTLFFDFLPIEIGSIRGMRSRIQLYTVPGQVFYNATRRMVLKGADAVAFVCDSQEPMLEACLESYENLRQNLEANEIDPDEIPTVLQYNKRDLPNALPIEILNDRVNAKGYPFYEAVAIKGIGVEETLRAVTKLVFKSLSEKYGGEAQASVPRAAVPAGVARSPSSRPSARTATIPPRPDAPAVRPRVPVPPRLESPEELLEMSVPELPVLNEEEPPLTGPARGFAGPRGTLVGTQGEADDLRRRIVMPGAELEVNIDELTQEEEIEELSLETDPGLHPHHPSPTQTNPNRRAPASPVRVEVAGSPGQTDVSLPIEIVLPTGASEMRLNLHLRLKLKRPR